MKRLAFVITLLFCLSSGTCIYADQIKATIPENVAAAEGTKKEKAKSPYATAISVSPETVTVGNNLYKPVQSSCTTPLSGDEIEGETALCGTLSVPENYKNPSEAAHEKRPI